jgi:predicted RNA binding protein YcfA (HicA-like mRNA interferase family)
MSLPLLSWREVVKVLQKKGFRSTRQKGSHIYLEDASGRYTVVPRHAEIKRSILLKILSEISLTKEEFLKLL